MYTTATQPLPSLNVDNSAPLVRTTCNIVNKYYFKKTDVMSKYMHTAASQPQSLQSQSREDSDSLLVRTSDFR